MTLTLDAFASEIKQRFDALGEQVSDQRLIALIQQQLNGLMDDKEWVRKMRFGKESPAELTGTKYARWGLDVGDIEFLYDIQQSLRGQRRITLDGFYQGPSDELERTWKTISDATYLPLEKVREIDHRALDGVFPRIPISWLRGNDRDIVMRGGKRKDGTWAAYQDTDAYQRAIRAMDTAESGFGSQLIGAQYVGELWEQARNASRVFALINTFEMTDPTAYLPVEVDFPEMLFVSESTANNSSNYTTVKTGSNRVQVDAKKFVIHQMWSGEMEEDSIIPFIPFLRGQAAKSLEYYSDSLVLNGDTTNAATGNINLDDADPADTKHYLAFDGIRHAGLVDNTNNQLDAAGVITLNALRGAKGRMLDSTYKADWGHPSNPEDLVFVGDPESADRIATLDEVIKFNQIGQRPLLNGEVARALGHPVISSIAVSKTEADGKVSTTASNNTKGQVVTFNRRGYLAGWRRRVKTEVERLPATDQTRIVYSLRMGFGRFTPTGAASGIESADVIYDVTL